MAFGDIGQFLGSSSKASSSTSVTLTTLNANLTAGRLGIIIVGKDNAATSDGNTSEVTSITDAAGNTWAKLREVCNAQGAGNAGATVSVWYTIATSNLGSAANVTINFLSSITAKAAVGWVYSLAAGSTISHDASATDAADDGADASSMAISGLSSKERIWLRGIAVENSGATTSITAGGSFTAIPASGTGGGLGTSNMSACGEFLISTNTGETSDPTTGSFDQASVFLAISEVLAAGTKNSWWAWSRYGQMEDNSV